MKFSKKVSATDLEQKPEHTYTKTDIGIVHATTIHISKDNGKLRKGGINGSTVIGNETVVTDR